MRGGGGRAAAAAAAAAAVAAAAALAHGIDAAAEQGAPAGGLPAGVPYWTFLGGVAAGDSFTYRICDALYGPHAPAARGRGGGWACYLAEMRVEAVVPVSGGRGASAHGGGGGWDGGADVYVVRAAADWDGGVAAAGAHVSAAGGADEPPLRPESILLVVDGGGGRLAVRHALPADRALAESLQRTIFWRGGLGGGAELAYGEPVAELIRGAPSTALLVSGSRVSSSGLVEYTAVHGLPRPAYSAEGGWRAHGQGISKVVLAAGIGLPVSARVYGGAPPPLDHYHPGRPLFEYEMVSLGRDAAPGGGQHGPGAAQGDPISNPHYPVHGGRPGSSAAERADGGGSGGGSGGW